MDAMQNDSANATDVIEVEAPEGADAAPGQSQPPTGPQQEATNADASVESDVQTPAASADAGAGAGAGDAAADPASSPAPDASTDVPQQRAPEPEPTSAKGKKRKSAPKPKSAAGTKSLVVLREGKVHYADDSVVVLDLDDAAHPDTDVHDVVDKLSELRDAAESSGRTEAVALVAELIQSKALA